MCTGLYRKTEKTLESLCLRTAISIQNKNLSTITKYLNKTEREISTVIGKYFEYIAIKRKKIKQCFIAGENDYRKKGKKRNGRVY